MTSRSLDVSQTNILSESFAVPSVDSFESIRPVIYPSIELRSESPPKSSIAALHKILNRLAVMELPGKEHTDSYLRYVY